MPGRAAKASLSSLKGWFSASSSRMSKVVRGNGTAGERAGPTRSGNNDAKIGSRLDVGEIIKKDGMEYRRYNWQFNIDAENSTIRKAAQKNSHRKVSYGDVEIKQNPTKDESKTALNRLFQDLEDNAED